MQKRFLFLIGALVLVVALFITAIVLGRNGKDVPEELTKPVTLRYWRVFDGQDDFAQIIGAYRALHPHVTIEYRQFSFDEYEDALLRAWAKGEGPDIFAIQNTWFRKYQVDGFLAPIPPTTQVAQFHVVKALGIRPEIRVTAPVSQSLTVSDLRAQFVDAVAEDVVTENQIFGLPLSLDTLALYYNKRLLTQAKIAVPLENYTDLLNHVDRLRLQDADDEIVQAAVSFGTSMNITRSQDILLLLMMQNLEQVNLELLESGGRANLLTPSPVEPGQVPAKNALDFYTSFASPARESYTWNEDQPASLDAFTEGRLAYFPGYAYHKPMIDAAAPTLEYGVIPFPQLQREVNIANYWAEVVSSRSANTNVAWDFVQFAARADQVTSYLNNTQKPTALKSLIAAQLQDPFLAPFANQTLLAKTWYHGYQPRVAEQYVQDAITAIVEGTATPDETLQRLSQQLLSTYSPKGL
ncbi:MAG: extracellular solute-binding protein [Candidatus Kerfeldbacteria bacterium]|nr:extracellular solute-binding protein [Candidatus Kerfeldbacteria bacterium]